MRPILISIYVNPMLDITPSERAPTPVQCCQKSVVLIGVLGPAGHLWWDPEDGLDADVVNFDPTYDGSNDVLRRCAQAWPSQPNNKIMVRGALRGQILRQRLPLAAGG